MICLTRASFVAVSGEDRLVATCMGTNAAKSMSSVMFCKGEELGFTVIRFAPERIVRTIIIFPAMYFGDRQSSKLEDGRILKNSFVRRAEAIMSFLSKRISFGIPVEPDVCPMT